MVTCRGRSQSKRVLSSQGSKAWPSLPSLVSSSEFLVPTQSPGGIRGSSQAWGASLFRESRPLMGGHRPVSREEP